jgi:hypothetical protein
MIQKLKESACGNYPFALLTTYSILVGIFISLLYYLSGMWVYIFILIDLALLLLLVYQYIISSKSNANKKWSILTGIVAVLLPLLAGHYVSTLMVNRIINLFYL